MSVRGNVTLECDTKDCHAEEVIEATNANVSGRAPSVLLGFFAAGWQLDDNGALHCPQCIEEGK